MQYTKRFVFTTNDHPSLEIRSENYPVEILAADSNDTTIELIIETGEETKISEDELSDILDASLDVNANIIKISTNEDLIASNSSMCDFFKSMFTGKNSPRIRVNIQTPAGSNLNAKTENGAIIVRGLQSNSIKVVSENSKISLHNCKAAKYLETENGLISLIGCLGDAHCIAENGSIKIENSSGSLKAENENGPIKLSNCSGEELVVINENGPVKILKANYKKVRIENENGSVYYDMLPIETGDFNITNENGKITMIIPNEIPINLSSKNENGRTHIGIDGDYEKRKHVDLSCIYMTKGIGKLKIKFSNENGSLIFLAHPNQSTSAHSSQKNNHHHHRRHEHCHKDYAKFGKQQFDFSSFGEVLDDIFDDFPRKINRVNIKEKFEKIKEKMPPDLGGQINTVINSVMDEVGNIVSTIKAETEKKQKGKAYDFHYTYTYDPDSDTKYEDAMNDYAQAMDDYVKEKAKYSADLEKFNTEMEAYNEDLKVFEKAADDSDGDIPDMPPIPPLPPLKPLKPIKPAKPAKPCAPDEPCEPCEPDEPGDPCGHENAKSYSNDLKNLLKKKIKTAVYKAQQKREEYTAPNAGEASKIKILDLLQAGKISVDDAERLLKALDK